MYVILESNYTNMAFVDSLLSQPTLDNVVFNPFELNEEFECMPFSMVDPDTHFYNDLRISNTSPVCNYYLEGNGLSLIHLSVRSLPKKLEEFTSYLDTKKCIQCNCTLRNMASRY